MSLKKIIRYTENESKDINYDLFKDYFNFVLPSALAKRFQHQLGMKLLIYLIVLIQFLTFKIILNLSSKNTKL